MTDQERLEEIKAQYHILTRNGYDLGAWDEPFSWLIKRAQELEDIIYQDARQDVLEGLYEENKRYREALEFYADEGTYEVSETLPPTDEYHQPIEPVFKTVPIIYYDKGKEARKALEGTE